MNQANTTSSNTIASQNRNAPLVAKLLLVLTTSISNQNFLGQPWLPALLRLVPESYRRNAALRILGMSPHYFIYQWTSKYPSDMSRMEVLEAEHQRNKRSRKALYDNVLSTFVSSDMTVLDFGCGPGYLAYETARHAEQVIAVDISPGALACAEVLNGRDNIEYLRNSEQSIDTVDDASVDLVYSFAVVQHMKDEAIESIVEAWYRVLRSGGSLVCHVALRSEADSPSNDPTPDDQDGLGLRDHYALRMRYRTKDEFCTLLRRCGFEDVTFSSFEGLDALEDDVAREPLIICSKP